MNSPLGRLRMMATALAAAAMLSAASGQSQRPQGQLLAAIHPAAPRPAPAPLKGPAPPRIEMERLQQARDAAEAESAAAGPFDATTWHVAPPPPPPPPAVKPAPPPPPSAPPLPFNFLGLYEEGGQRVILLTRGDRLYTVSEGEVIDRTYRVDRLEGGLLELTYLPLSIKQTLNVGASG